MSMIDKIRSRITMARGRFAPQLKLQVGAGGMINKVRDVLGQVSAKVSGVRPRVVPVVKDINVIDKVNQLLAKKKFLGSVDVGGSMAVEDERAKPANGRNISIEV